MKNLIACILGISLMSATTFAQGNAFEVRYVGGSVASSVKPDDWHNTLTVNSDLIVLKLRDGQEVKIDPKSVKLLTHGRQASRRIGKYAALAGSYRSHGRGPPSVVLRVRLPRLGRLAVAISWLPRRASVLDCPATRASVLACPTRGCRATWTLPENVT